MELQVFSSNSAPFYETLQLKKFVQRQLCEETAYCRSLKIILYVYMYVNEVILTG